MRRNKCQRCEQKEEAGKVIGKEGRIANAIRTVVKAAAAKVEKKVTVEILTNNEE